MCGARRVGSICHQGVYTMHIPAFMQCSYSSVISKKTTKSLLDSACVCGEGDQY